MKTQLIQNHRSLFRSMAVLPALLFMLATTDSARAASATWLGSPFNNNWIAAPTTNNWSTGSGTFPGSTSGTSNGDIASFTNNSAITTINCASAFVIGGFVFDSTNASAYTINTSGGTWRLNNNTFVRVTSTVTNRQTITGTLRLASTGTATFLNDSTTPSATLNITSGVSVNNSGTSGTLILAGTNTGPNIMGAYTEQTPATILGTLIKTNSGTWVLTGNNTYHNNTFVLGGTLMLIGNGAIPNSPVISVNGATLNVSNVLTSVNAVFVTNSGTLWLTNSHFRTPLTIGALTASNATFRLSVNGATPFTNIVVTAALNAGPAVALSIDRVANLPSSTTFALISYTGTDPDPASFTVTVPAGYTAGAVTVDTANKLVTVNVTPPAGASSLVWVGATNSVLVSNWDTNSGVRNWVDAATLTFSQAYADPDSVAFDDSASNSVVTLNTTVLPFGIAVTNYSLNYTFNGNGKISGAFGLTKVGNATLTLAETGGDDFAGGVTVMGGTLVLDNTNSAISGGLTVAGGATVQIGNNDGSGALPSGSVAVDGALIFSRSNSVTVSTAISGAGSLTQNGNGTLTLNNTNSYTGSTVVSKGTLALTGAGTISNSVGLLISNATFDVSGLATTTSLLADLSITNAGINVSPTNLQTPILTTSFKADGITARSNIINVLVLPPIASYPSTITLIKSVNLITLTGGNFNFALGSLPAGSPAYAGSLSESGDGTAILLTLTAGPVGVRPSVTWAGVINVSANTNWSDRVNWQLPGVPLATDNVFFDGTTTVGDNLTVNNVVDTSFTTATLTYNQTASSQWHNTLIPAGSVLTVTGATGIGTGTATGSTASVTISGEGELDANGALNVNTAGGATDSHVTLDMSGLNAFKNIAPSSTMALGTATQNILNFSLASNSIINVATLNIEATGGGNGRSGNFNLGVTTNTIYANTINISTGKGAVTKIQFGVNAPDGTVTIGGTGGGSARTTMLLGNGTSGTAVCNGQLLLAGHLANVMAGTVTLGGVGGSTGNGDTGTVTFDNGTFDVTSILMGSSTSAHSSSGTFTVGGDVSHTATLTVNSAGGGSLVLGNASISGGTGAGTLNINAKGIANINCSITKNTTAGAINTATINLIDGVLNQQSGVIGTLGVPIDALNLSDNGSSDTVIRLHVAVGATNIAASAVSILGGVTTINIDSLAGLLGTTQIPLISYNNGISPIAGLVLGTVPAGYTVGNGGLLVDNVANQSIDIIVTPPAPIIWRGAVGSVLDSTWNTSTLNWLNGVTPTAYADGNYVQFDDSASNNVATLAATVLPAGINVSNNVLNYTFNGTGKISGPVGLVKHGSSALILDNSGSNDFTGVVNILGGSLQIGNNDANGLLPSVSVINNGTLIFNRTDSNTAANVISGTGGVTKNGSGTLTLSGVTSSYGGGTIVNAGALRPTGLTALGTGGVTVNSSGILVEAGGNATNNPITMAGGVLGVTAADFILATTSSLTIAANTTNIIQSADPQNPSTSRNIQVDGLVSGSGVAVVLNATNITSPDGNQGVRFRTTASSDFSGTIIYTNNTKGELAVSGAGPFSPIGTGKLILYGGAYDGGNTLTCPASGGYVEFNIRNSGGTTTIPTDFQIAGSGAVVFNGLGTGNGAVVTLGNLKIGGSQEVIGYRGAGTTTNTINFPTVTLTGGNATFSPHSTGFGAANQAGADLSLGNISETSASGIIKGGVGNLTLTGLNAYTGNTTVSNGTLFLTGDSALTNSPVIKIAAGSLDVSGRNDQTLTLISGQTLFANGAVNGALTASAGSSLSPGAGACAIGTLTVNGAVTADLQGTTLMEINKTNAPGTNDLVVASAGTINYGGTLTVSNLGPALVAGDSFKLFNAGIISGAFTATNLPPLNAGLAWTNILLNGTLSVVATVNPNPTNINAAVVSGNTLTLLWPADHTGWRLQAQTNSINTGLNSNWVDVPGSTTVNSVSIAINPANGTVFFRMIYP